MASAVSALDAAITEVDRLRHFLKKAKAPQVRSIDERALAKVTAKTWFENHRRLVEPLPVSDINSVDEAYRVILENSDRNGARSKYLSTLKSLRADLIRLRSESLLGVPEQSSTTDQPPDFSPLIADVAMQQILISRWNECLLCLEAKAALAATVMMGGLLEALLLARINRERDQSALFTAKAAPKISKTNSVKPLAQWMLNDFINVLSEVKWITVSAGAVGAVLKDYRNYIHPQKQLTHGMHLEPNDASLFWAVTKNIARQLLMGLR
jgi:hypothetical protein